MMDGQGGVKEWMMDGQTDRQRGGWIDGRVIRGWMDNRWIDRGLIGWMDGWINGGWTDIVLDSQMRDGLIDGQTGVNGWMDGLLDDGWTNMGWDGWILKFTNKAKQKIRTKKCW